MKWFLIVVITLSSCSAIVEFEEDVEIKVCGNGIVEGVEVCDSTSLNGETCGSQGFSNGLLTCLPDCDGFDDSHCNCETCGEDFCIDLQTDITNCGSCGNACDTESGVECFKGECVQVIVCEDGPHTRYGRTEENIDCWGNLTTEHMFFCEWTCCEGTAVINMIAGSSWSVNEGNPEHCGGCGVQCSEEQSCIQYDYENPIPLFKCE